MARPANPGDLAIAAKAKKATGPVGETAKQRIAREYKEAKAKQEEQKRKAEEASKYEDVQVVVDATSGKPLAPFSRNPPPEQLYSQEQLYTSRFQEKGTDNTYKQQPKGSTGYSTQPLIRSKTNKNDARGRNSNNRGLANSGPSSGNLGVPPQTKTGLEIFESALEAQQRRQAAVENFESKYLNPIVQGGASVFTLGFGKPVESRSTVGRYAEKITRIPLSLVYVPSAIVKATDKAYITGRGLATKEARPQVIAEYKRAGPASVEEVRESFNPKTPEGKINRAFVLLGPLIPSLKAARETKVEVVNVQRGVTVTKEAGGPVIDQTVTEVIAKAGKQEYQTIVKTQGKTTPDYDNTFLRQETSDLTINKIKPSGKVSKTYKGLSRGEERITLTYEGIAIGKGDIIQSTTTKPAGLFGKGKAVIQQGTTRSTVEPITEDISLAKKATKLSKPRKGTPAAASEDLKYKENVKLQTAALESQISKKIAEFESPIEVRINEDISLTTKPVPTTVYENTAVGIQGTKAIQAFKRAKGITQEFTEQGKNLIADLRGETQYVKPTKSLVVKQAVERVQKTSVIGRVELTTTAQKISTTNPVSQAQAAVSAVAKSENANLAQQAATATGAGLATATKQKTRTATTGLTGQKPKATTKTDLISGTIPDVLRRQKPRQTQQSEQETLRKLSLSLKQNTQQTPKQRSRSETTPVVLTKPITLNLQQPQEDQTVIQLTEQTTEQVFKTTPISLQIPEKTNRRIAGLLPPLFRTNKKTQAYVAEVRQKGVFKRIGGPTSQAEAINRGARTVKQTSAATFRIRKVRGFTVEPNNTPTTDLKDFYQSRREPGNIIQKTRDRISSPGEKREIPYKAKAQQFSKKTRQLFGGKT